MQFSFNLYTAAKQLLDSEGLGVLSRASAETTHNVYVLLSAIRPLAFSVGDKVKHARETNRARIAEERAKAEAERARLEAEAAAAAAATAANTVPATPAP